MGDIVALLFDRGLLNWMFLCIRLSRHVGGVGAVAVLW
jgi:hypothetical protein